MAMIEYATRSVFGTGTVHVDCGRRHALDHAPRADQNCVCWNYSSVPAKDPTDSTSYELRTFPNGGGEARPGHALRRHARDSAGHPDLNRQHVLVPERVQLD